MDNINELLQRRERIQKSLHELQNKKAVAEATEQRITKDIKEHLKVLKDTFNCDTYEEAVKLRDSMVKELEERCDELESMINKIKEESSE